MKEYVFKIVSENGKCRVELPEIKINGEYQAPDLKAAVANLKALQLARQLRDADRKVN